MTSKSRWQQYKEKNGGVSPLDLFNKNSDKAPKDLAEARFSTCESCEKFLKLTKQCLECGCLMNLKTRLVEAKCPLGKW